MTGGSGGIGPARVPAALGRWSWLATVVALGVLARFATIGSDTYWLVALGRWIASHGRIPHGVPFAAADSSGWANVPVLAELLLAALARVGPPALVVAQLAAAFVALVLTARAARRSGAGDVATAVVICAVTLGGLAALGVVRLQLFSIALIGVLLAVLRADHRRPGPRIWWAVVILAVWGNLHGAVLVGVALTGCYLGLSRLRRTPVVAPAVALASVAAVFVNPAGLATLVYYRDALSNEASARGTELWARPDPSRPFDLLLIVCALILLGCLTVRWRRVPAWESVAVAGLALATATSARHGIWLLLVAATPAALAGTRRPSTDPGRADPVVRPAPSARLSLLVGTLVAAGVAAASLLTGPTVREPGVDMVATVRASLPANGVVLADEPIAETLAAEGIRVWMANPIDAFDRADQRAYLDFVAGISPAALGHADLVIVAGAGRAAPLVRADPDFTVLTEANGYLVLRRR